MMQQRTSQIIAQPKRFVIFFHAIKTFKLIGSLLIDPRVPLLRKLLFLGSIGVLLAILIFPDTLNEVVLSTVLPLVGTVLGVPIDAGMDWIAFALLVVNFLHFFPEDLVSEHYQQIFGR